MQIHKLRQDRVALVKEARAALDAGKNDTFDKVTRDIDALDTRIAAEERMAAFETAAPVARDSLEGESRNYSIAKALAGFIEGKLEGRELEVSKALADASHETRGLRIPLSALAETRAEITAAGNPANANQAYGRFVPRLVADSVVLKAGATTLDGLGHGKFVLPTQTSGPDSAIAWLPESGSAPLGDAQFSSIVLGPHTAAVYMKLSRRALISNSIGLEQIVRADVSAAVGRIIDQAALGTSATNAPTGLRGLVAATVSPETTASGVAADLISAIEGLNGDADTVIISHAIAAAARKVKTLDGLPIPLKTQFHDKNVLVSNLLAGSTLIAAKASDMLVAYFNLSGAASVDVVVDTATYSSEGALKLAFFSDVDFGLKHAGGSAAWGTVVSGS